MPDVLDRFYVRQSLVALYASFGLTPTGRGTGPTDIEYYVDEVIKTGGWTTSTARGENNVGYWSDRIKNDLIAAGVPIGRPRLPGPGEPPAPTPAPPAAPIDAVDHAAFAGLQKRVDEIDRNLRDKLAELEAKLNEPRAAPSTTFEVTGTTGSTWGHQHAFRAIAKPVK